MGCWVLLIIDWNVNFDVYFVIIEDYIFVFDLWVWVFGCGFIVLEIGSGKGLFLRIVVEEVFEMYFVGVEIVLKYVCYVVYGLV